MREGWLNVTDSHAAKKASSLQQVFKLQHAVIHEGHFLLYKPPSTIQARAFDPTAAPAAPRPQTAPASASPNFNSASTLRHKSADRHPDLVLGNDGAVREGTVEAMCHELMFTENAAFVERAARTLSGWTGPETALSVLVELSALKESASRIGEVLTVLNDATPGLLLEPGCYNSARLLVEKGVVPHNPELGKRLRRRIETVASELRNSLKLQEQPADGKHTPVARTYNPGTLLSNTIEPVPDSPEALSHSSRTLTADEFMRMDIDLFASQIHLFHLKYFKYWSPVNDLSLLLVPPHLPPPSRRNPLVFNTNNIHFLGERVFNHVLYGDSTSSLDRRADVLSKWIDLAHLLKKKGDMVGYLAIITAVFSPPILRLRETWSVIDPSLIRELRDAGGKAMRILERRKLNGEIDTPDNGRAFVPRGVGSKISTSEAIPFFGDLCHCMDEAYAVRGRNVDFEKILAGLNGIEEALGKWRNEWVDMVESIKSTQLDKAEVEDIQDCLRALNAANQNPPSANSSTFFGKSLECEPSISGMYLHSHYHQKLPLSTGANVPLIFTDVLPSFSLFDRFDTLAISGSLHKKTPSSGLAASGYGPPNVQNPRPPPPSDPQLGLRRTRSFPPSKTNAQTTGYADLDLTTRQKTEGLQGDDAMIRAIRDVAGIGQQLFYSKDGELVLKSIEEDSASRPASVIEMTSKRQSVISRRQSGQTHSNGASPRVSTHGETHENHFPSTPVTTPIREGFASSPMSETSSLIVVPKGGTLERLVDILVLGVEDFSARMNGSEGTTPLLRMNMDVFTVTFFATFRR